MLIDFGGAKSRFSAGKATSFKVYTNGYAPMEQVQSDGRAGPYTDIYAVGATMWRMMNNRPRPDENGEPTLHPPMVEDRAFAVYAGKPDPLVSAAELAAGRFSP